MQSRIPQGAEPGPTPADIEAGLSAALASVMSGARRRAGRDGDRQVDTAHLLHSLLEYEPQVRAVFDGGPQVARLLGYLVQRSIGYGLQWQGTVEDSGAVPLVAAAKETVLSPAAAGAMEAALDRAVLRGEPQADGVDLLAALAADPECRAVEVLRSAGVDVGELLLRIEGGRETGCESGWTSAR
ncbi:MULTISPECIES: Clp protease N-terminal domain-containing protein [Streptomyces]|uniref:Peptidase n=1 Tax=Streptomyces lasiicapitis TaxID=1923961 RepID=A0ABQ2MV71_9ACTN|nr:MULTISPECIES: Clp protease N-terminal domain-containing protein [Streptomyces]GGO58223.1 peptidase [Streptomyces lasiicapitis]